MHNHEWTTQTAENRTRLADSRQWRHQDITSYQWSILLLIMQCLLRRVSVRKTNRRHIIIIFIVYLYTCNLVENWEFLHTAYGEPISLQCLTSVLKLGWYRYHMVKIVLKTHSAVCTEHMAASQMRRWNSNRSIIWKCLYTWLAVWLDYRVSRVRVRV